MLYLMLLVTLWLYISHPSLLQATFYVPVTFTESCPEPSLEFGGWMTLRVQTGGKEDHLFTASAAAQDIWGLKLEALKCSDGHSLSANDALTASK